MLRRLWYVVVCALVIPAFTSCSKKPAAPKADVIIWHWMTDRQAAFDKLAAQYEKEKGVRVQFETYAPSESYRDKIRAAASGKLLPEVYNPLGDKRELAAFIKSGYIADLTPEMEEGWKNRFYPKPLGQNTFDASNEFGVAPGIYGVPIDVNAMEIFYNKDLFKQAGLDPEQPPKTWDEFLAAGKKLRSAGIQPFASGFGEGWLISAFAASYEFNLLGRQGIIDTYKGKIPYTDPRWVKIFKLFDEMKQTGMFVSGIATMVNKDAERLFTTGKAAMALNGSWGINVYFAMNPTLNYGIMLPPRLKDGPYPMQIYGGEGSSFNFNPMSPNKDKAVAFFKWLTEKNQQVQLSTETRNIPANKEAGKDMPPVLRAFSEDISKTFDPLPLIEDWQVTNVKNVGLQAIIIGEKTPEQVAREVQAEKERQQKNKQK